MEMKIDPNECFVDFNEFLQRTPDLPSVFGGFRLCSYLPYLSLFSHQPGLGLHIWCYTTEEEYWSRIDLPVLAMSPNTSVSSDQNNCWSSSCCLSPGCVVEAGPCCCVASHLSAHLGTLGWLRPPHQSYGLPPSQPAQSGPDHATIRPHLHHHQTPVVR